MSGLPDDKKLPHVISGATFTVFAGLVGLAYILLVVASLRLPLEYDEAFNLTVVKNLAEIFFYGSNGAVYGDGKRVLFDPYVTTGPVLIVPTALVWWLTNGTLWAVRLVPVAFFALYLWAVWRLSGPSTSRWVRLGLLVGPLALVVPTAFEHAAFVPTRLVGETTAATLILWGLVQMSKNRLLWGGILVGLAVQTKLVAIVPAIAVAASVVVAGSISQEKSRLRSALVWIAGFLAPTLTFEFLRIIVLGFRGYVDNTLSVVNYSRSVAQFGDKGQYDAMMKMTSLGNMFHTHSFMIVALLLIATLVLASIHQANTRSSVSGTDLALDDQLRFTPRHAALLAGGISLLFWILVVQERSGRHSILGLMLLLPGLVQLFLSQIHSSISHQPRRLIVAFVLSVGAFLIVGASGMNSIRSLAKSSILDEQKRIASIIQDSGTPSLATDGWWQRPEFQVLTSLPVESDLNRASLLIFDPIQGSYVMGISDMTQFMRTQLYADKCLYPVYVSENYVLCRPS